MVRPSQNNMPWSWTNTLRSIIITDVYQAMQVPFQAHLYPAEVLKLPHPVNMTRQRLSALDSGWFVTYKADGVRYLWIRAVYLGRMFDITINRRCEMNILQNKASDVESGIYFACQPRDPISYARGGRIRSIFLDGLQRSHLHW